VRVDEKKKTRRLQSNRNDRSITMTSARTSRYYNVTLATIIVGISFFLTERPVARGRKPVAGTL